MVDHGYSDTSLSSLLRAWLRYRLALLLASLRPRHAAGEIAALVAGNGNPSGG